MTTPIQAPRVLASCGLAVVASLLSALGGCHSEGLATGSCADFHDAASCASHASCTPVSCPGCDSSSSFLGCYEVGRAPECVLHSCPEPPPLPCSQLDLSSCAADTRCVLHGNCSGGTFCADKGTPPLFCPARPCSSLTDEASCVADANCHAVFRDLGTCDCIPAGCCTYFDHCADGPAQCAAPVLTCQQLPPTCEGPFVVGYHNGCPEGCLRSAVCSDCGATGCAAGTSCQSCWGSYMCLPDGSVC